MKLAFIENIFKNLQTPVVVCRNEEQYPVEYMNPSVRMMLNPLLTTDNLKESTQYNTLSDILMFADVEASDRFFEMLKATGSIDNFPAMLLKHEQIPVKVLLSATMVQENNDAYFFIYIDAAKQQNEFEPDKMLSTLFYITSHAEGVEEAISQILAFAGEAIHVSRAYIFEEISPTMAANTYEWCAEGVQPQIKNLQQLEKADYNYDVIVQGGKYIAGDIRDLPENDRAVLETQGIKALAILPLIHMNKPLGYIGFDDCKNDRNWSTAELELLQNIANVIVTLLVRRNSENQLNQSIDILQTISDNLDSVIYVNDLETHELIFFNKMFQQTIVQNDEDAAHKKCWMVAQKNQTGQCPFCPMYELVDEKGNIVQKELVWEFQNTMNNKWYLVRDAIIKWIDGRNVHIETATEITRQKEYSRKMEEYAYVDVLTGVHNRMWGYKAMAEMLSSSTEDRENMSLVFVDMDGLKYVNDTFGHDAGDDMIVETVDSMHSVLRKSDTICRWGGDEFILLLRCNTELAAKIMKKVEAELERRNEQQGRNCKLAISYGITSFYMDDNVSIDTIVSNADKLMYEDKMSKREQK